MILAQETLTREDFLGERNLEVRRVIQERMGERFVTELGGRIIEVGPRGTLYEVPLPSDDPKQVARYLQVQDASTRRQYFLRVPPGSGPRRKPWRGVSICRSRSIIPSEKPENRLAGTAYRGTQPHQC